MKYPIKPKERSNISHYLKKYKPKYIYLKASTGKSSSFKRLNLHLSNSELVLFAHYSINGLAFPRR
jgi:hypothetical protein